MAVDRGETPSADEHALALATPHRFVVIASPESLAWKPAFDHGGEVFVLDPLRMPDADVIGPLQPPNDGPSHLAMPRWAVYDCAEVPGAVISLLRSPVSSPYRSPLDPLAVVLATPHAEADVWHLYSLTVRDANRESSAIRARLVRSAMAMVRAKQATLVVSWPSSLFGRLASQAPVELLAARTPLHGGTVAATIAVHAEGTPLPRLVRAPVAPTPRSMEAAPPFLDRLEALLEEGRRLYFVPGPRGSASAEIPWPWTLHEVVR